MKTIEDYLKLPYRLEIIKDPYEGGYVASFPELPGCLTTSETLEGIIDNAEDAKREWLLASIEIGNPIPEPETEQQYSGQYRLRMPKSLHRSLAMHAKREHISLNQYCIYLLTKYDAYEDRKDLKSNSAT
ncbi:toxin-antitoxin system HicB family antitoxin [Bilifractor sp. LCP19S3_H10]|uniref:toxin-antitoxin system HicB family antitoxin n=1 Tax=Bilifractor sp. LCP19S3_H10 TaxID=3438736 RepID=UPI003F8EA5C4